MQRTAVVVLMLLIEAIVIGVVFWGWRNEPTVVNNAKAIMPQARSGLTAIKANPTISPTMPANPSGLIPELSPALLSFFAPLPAEAPVSAYPISDELVHLGRMLYYDPRLSITHKVSCNTCHPLNQYGADGLAQSLGHDGKPVRRNAQTVYNAALHIAQFWDGRSPTVEEQAKMPIVAAAEMGMPNFEYVEQVLQSIPDYVQLFVAAFPNDPNPITYANVGIAIGAFERRLLLPSRFDRFLAGDYAALSPDEQRGLATFITTGCPTCHVGVTIGGLFYKKLGEIEPYPVDDQGRFEITGLEADRQVFKVPSLRNVAKTAPYLHNGSIATLEEMIQLMARHQLGKSLSDQQIADIVLFLQTLTGEIPTDFIAAPPLPPSGPDTPLPQAMN